MKRLGCFLLVLFVVAAWATAAFSVAFEPVAATLAVNANLRTGPSTDTASQMVVPKGSKVTVLELEGAWLQVQYGSIYGYIRSDLIQESTAPASAPTQSPGGASAGGKPVLKMGMRGADVRELQNALNALGYSVGIADGIFGLATKAAILSLQQRYRVAADGIAGKETHNLIDALLAGGAGSGSVAGPTAAPASTISPVAVTRTLRAGMTGDDVLFVNQRLEQLGYLSFARSTYDAAPVKAFQQRNSLVADGIAGPKTQSVLFSVWAMPVAAAPQATPAPAASTPAPGAITRILRPSMTGSDVLAVNERLLQLGFVSTATSAYNESAIIAFQALNGLAVDGITGAVTLNRLFSASAVGVSSAQPAPSPTPSAPAAAFARVLKAGMTGSDVLALNTRLAELGYITNPTNVYNAAAVLAFQQRNALIADAGAGPATISRLFSSVAVSAPTTVASATAAPSANSLQYGSKGEAVKALQRALQQKGYYTEGIDGDFGAGTRMAVSLFQKVHGLSETGVADSQTQALLYSSQAQPAPAATPFAPEYPGAGALASPPTASQVAFANWDREIKPRYTAGQLVTVYDYNARLAWQLRLYALGAHADAEPLSAKDTEIMYRAFGLKNTWTPRPVWAIMPDGKVYMASIHNMPHLTYSIKDNNFDGHLCLHFPRDMADAQAVGSYAVTHQNCILAGWQATQAMR